jgi:hypothetical protein
MFQELIHRTVRTVNCKLTRLLALQTADQYMQVTLADMF